MIVSTDAQGRYLGHLDSGYPALPDVLQRVRETETAHNVIDVPPFTPEFWYFPDGVPTVRPVLDYQVTEREEDTDRVTVLSGIPANVRVTVQGPDGIQTVDTDGEDLELVLRTPGEYRVGFDPFPYQPVSLLIEVTEKGA